MLLQPGPGRDGELSVLGCTQRTERSGSCICMDLHKFAYQCAEEQLGKRNRDSRVSCFKILLPLKRFIV